MMMDRKTSLILLGALFFISWFFVVFYIYPWIDNQEWLPPPLAFLVTIGMYGFMGFLFSFGLVKFDTDLTINSIYMGIVEALGLLTLDGLEPPLVVNLDGTLNTSVLGWRADLLATLYYFEELLNIPLEYRFYGVIVGLILVWSLVVILASRSVAKEWIEALAY